MALTGKQKAAMLLTTLDVATATELLKGFDHEVVEELAVELSYMDAAGIRSGDQAAAVTQEFSDALSAKPRFEMKSFLDDMLKGTLGDDRATKVRNEIQTKLRKRDPFLPVLKADLGLLATILDTEHPQAVAVVLAELSPKKSSELLGRLSEGVRVSAVSRMTSVGTMAREAQNRIAEMIGAKIDARIQARTQGAGPVVDEVKPEDSIRKVAVVLRNLEKEQRDVMLKSVRKKDKATADAVSDMMVVWEDIPAVHDRSMQEGLRGLDEQALSLALFKADEDIAQKVKSNISARAASMVEEEASLMSAPKKSDVEDARDRILGHLRDLNRNGDLMWQDQE
ncbi:FliG C-terminal domain-containing protein [Planctomycetota bacterium]